MVHGGIHLGECTLVLYPLRHSVIELWTLFTYMLHLWQYHMHIVLKTGNDHDVHTLAITPTVPIQISYVGIFTVHQVLVHTWDLNCTSQEVNGLVAVRRRNPSPLSATSQELVCSLWMSFTSALMCLTSFSRYSIFRDDFDTTIFTTAISATALSSSKCIHLTLWEGT